MEKAVIPMDSCFEKSITASYTISTLNGSTLSLSIPTELNEDNFTILPGNPILFSYDVDYNLANSTIATTRTLLYISLGAFNIGKKPIFNRLLLKIHNLPKILYTGANQSINFKIYFYYGSGNSLLLRDIEIPKGQITNINDDQNTFLIEIGNDYNLSLISSEEVYRVMIPKNWMSPQLVATTVINQGVITDTSFNITIPRKYTFPNYIAGDISHQFTTTTGDWPVATTSELSTTIHLSLDDGGSNISDRSIANYFRFIKLTLMGCPTLTTTTTDTLPIFSLYLKVAGESDTIHLVSKPYTQLHQSFDGTYYVDLKNMCIISKDIFNKSVINT